MSRNNPVIRRSLLSQYHPTRHDLISAPSVSLSLWQAISPQQKHQRTDSNAPPVIAASASGQEDILATLDRLGELKEKGYVTEEEFATKKAELLSRL